MEEKKFAELNQEQLKKINDLEKIIGVTLIAYDNEVLQQGAGGYSNNTQDEFPS